MPGATTPISDLKITGVEAIYLRLPQVKFMQPLRPDERARIELDGELPRWRFRVVREADGTLLAAGELVAQA